MRTYIIGLILSLIIFPFSIFAQTNDKYDKEEISVVNQFLDRLIDGERFRKLNKNADDTLIIYFNPTLQSSLDKNPLFDRDYKTNELIKNLENNRLAKRVIDTVQIKNLQGIKILFESEPDYNTSKYLSDKVIGNLDISRVSFNKEMTVGYFYYSVYCGEDCGWGDLIKIEKKNGVWEITKYISSWVS